MYSFQVIVKDQKQALYINSMGEQASEMASILARLLSMCYFRQSGNDWCIETVKHSLQKDATSCGVFVIKVIYFHCSFNTFKIQISLIVKIIPT